MGHEQGQRREGGTLSLRSRNRNRKGSPKSKALKGHEIMLEKLKAEGAMISIAVTRSDLDGGKTFVARGILIDYDKFTIVIQNVGEEGVVGEPVVFFKHAIESFMKVEGT